MKEQYRQTKNSTTLSRHLLEIYEEYINRLQKAYETMNEFDMEISPSYETMDDSSLTTEELITKRKEYICWAGFEEKGFGGHELGKHFHF